MSNKIINYCQFIGNLGKDPEVRYLPSGSALVKFSIAVNMRVKRNDEWQTETQWVDITAFGNLGERVAKALHKGSKVIVQTQFRTRQYEVDGKKRTGWEFILDDFEFASSPRTQDGSTSSEPDDAGDDDGYDDIPF